MYNLGRLHTMSVLLLVGLFGVKVTSTQEGPSYFFYQQPEYPRDCKEVREQCSSNNLNGVYTIKPDGYSHPFEVYCDNEVGSGGWTVIQRRIDGSLTFQRNWKDYRSGFGFLSSEFWIGNDKLSYLTNQAVYELRIDMVLSNGSSLFIKYNSFRISDEWRHYAIATVEEFTGNSSCVVSMCPAGTKHGHCTCQRFCTDHVGMTNCEDDCTETCVSEGCYITETSSRILNGESYINNGCTQNCTCINNQLSCDTNYECSPDATCGVQNGVRRCYCNEGFDGNGETCSRTVSVFRDYYDAYQAGQTTDGVYSVLPTGWSGSAFEVFCNMTIDGGGWTVFQRRIDGVTDFYRDWAQYKQGFGTKNQGNDFWLGNEQLHYLTNQKDYILRIDIIISSDVALYNEYTSFSIGNESTKYQMNYGSYRGGNAGNYLYYNNGGRFSTHDQDNDECIHFDCSEGHRGGWWYNPVDYGTCTECYYSNPFCYYFETRSDCHNICSATNPNGVHNGANGQNIFYYNCNNKFIEMKIRPSSA
ncbi:Ryncolin-4 [Holothuria leucospilota]|uniref:Ryncolin-4 n=1 Tax=Holothuria leucospilota TaxID=206669 RepID=A0A9Q1BUL3_HOLLE|nr:Ryncolin-4 [Holothuria leucospilota]